MTDWANLCVLNHVLNIIGPDNCINFVCKQWKQCTKIYTHIDIKNPHDLNMLLTYPFLSHVEKLNFFEYPSESENNKINLNWFLECKSLKEIHLSAITNANIRNLSKFKMLESIVFDYNVDLTIDTMNSLINLPLRKLDIASDNEFVDNDFIISLCEFKLLDRLWLEVRNDISDGLQLLCQTHSHTMRELHLSNSNIDDADLCVILSMKSLNILEINNCDHIIGEIDEKYIENSMIHSLKIQSCENLTNNGLHAFGAFKHLRAVHLLSCEKISDEGIIVLMSRINLTKLKVINMISLQITDASIHAITKSKCKSNITKLSISNCINITDDGLREISNMENLTTLDFSECLEITDKGLIEFMKKIKKGTNKLLKVSMSGIEFITSVGMEAFIKSNIKILDISGCPNINDTGLISLMSPRLEKLNMCDTGITDNGIRAFKKVVETCEIIGGEEPS